MEAKTVILTIILMSLVTLAPRTMPLGFLGGRNLPRPLLIWLRYVPVAALSAILALQVLRPGDSDAQQTTNLYLWACMPTFVMAIWQKNLFVTVVTGVLTVALLRFFMNA